MGKYYPAYHCNKRGHYFRVSTKEFNETIVAFIKDLNVTPEYVDQLKTYVMEQWSKRQEETQKDTSIVDTKIMELRAAAKATAEKIRYLSSETAIKYMEADLIQFENQIAQLEASKTLVNTKKEVNMESVVSTVGHFLEHLEELLIDPAKPLKAAEYFGLLFNEVPTYEELVSGTPKLAHI